MVTISYNVHCCKECHFFSDRESPEKNFPHYYCDHPDRMQLLLKLPNIPEHESRNEYIDIEKEVWWNCPFMLGYKPFHIVNEINKIIEHLSILNQKIYDNQK